MLESNVFAELSPLLLSLYRGARELPRLAFEEFALGQIKPMLGFNSAIWAQGQTDGKTVQVSWAYQHAIDPESIKVWQQLNARDKLIPLTVNSPGKTVRSHTSSLFPERADTEIRDYAARFGCEQVLIMSVPDGDVESVRWLAVYRDDPDALYSDTERMICDAVMPHLMEALSINRLATHQQPDDPPPTEPKRLPLAVCDSTGRIRYAQDRFVSLLQLEWSEADETWLPTPLCDAISSRNDAVFVGRQTICRIRRRADMLLVEIRRHTPIDRLPPQRARIAWMYAIGYTHKHVAKALGLSPSTVRNQLAAAYRDLDIGTRAQLMAMASAAPG